MAGKGKGGGSAGAIYFFGIFGAWVYFFSNAHSFGAVVVGFFQGLFWPAWMVYEAFSALNA